MATAFTVKNKKTLFIGVIALVVFLAAFLYGDNVLDQNNNYKDIVVPKEDRQSPVLKVGDTSIYVDIADTPALREQGLSGKISLPEDQGMYFIFDRPGFYPFWMKEMNFPIDIIWIGENMSVVDITVGAAPDSFPKTFAPTTPARYVLEVNAGFAERRGIKIGDQVSLARRLE